MAINSQTSFREGEETAGFEGRKAIVATIHEKEQVIIPALHSLGLIWTRAARLDTDQFGTFSGEITRKDTMEVTALKKARLGIELSDARIAIASEGSFGPHGSLPWVASGVELLLFFDADRDWVFTESSVSFETNYGHIVTDEMVSALSFARKKGFPTHGMVMMPGGRDESGGRENLGVARANTGGERQNLGGGRPILGDETSQFLFKGITDETRFEELFYICRSKSLDGMVWIETDMRAHVNPTRMKQIGDLAEKLANRIQRHCPECHLPGFGRIGQNTGLSCSGCGFPTEMIKEEIWGCPHCNETRSTPRSDGKQFAEPQYCGFCNP